MARPGTAWKLMKHQVKLAGGASMLLINSFPPCCARLTLEPPFWLAAQYRTSFMDFIGGLANLSREHLALPCPIWKITRGSLHGLIKDSLEWGAWLRRSQQQG
jgi:hypothetical protein